MLAFGGVFRIGGEGEFDRKVFPGINKHLTFGVLKKTRKV